MSCKAIFLFLLGILVILSEIWTLNAAITLSRISIEISVLEVHWYDYAHSFVWILIGVGICQYALKEEEKVLKMLVGLLILALIYQIIGLAMTPNKETANTEVDIQTQKLEAMMPNYDWSGKGRNSSQEKATDLWNSLQNTVKCCGLKDGHDWNKFRPGGLAENVYPSSCCFIKNSGYCEQDTYTIMTGCVARLKELGASATNVRLWIVAFLVIVIASMSYCLYKKSDRS